MFNPEWLGVPAAVLVLFSYLFSNQVKLRIVNAVASTVFTAYGIALMVVFGFPTGLSTMLLNAFCVVVHIVWLFRYFRKKKKENADGRADDNDEKL